MRFSCFIENLWQTDSCDVTVASYVLLLQLCFIEKVSQNDSRDVLVALDECLMFA